MDQLCYFYHLNEVGHKEDVPEIPLKEHAWRLANYKVRLDIVSAL